MRLWASQTVVVCTCRSANQARPDSGQASLLLYVRVFLLTMLNQTLEASLLLYVRVFLLSSLDRETLGKPDDCCTYVSFC